MIKVNSDPMPDELVQAQTRATYDMGSRIRTSPMVLAWIVALKHQRPAATVSALVRFSNHYATLNGYKGCNYATMTREIQERMARTPKAAFDHAPDAVYAPLDCPVLGKRRYMFEPRDLDALRAYETQRRDADLRTSVTRKAPVKAEPLDLAVTLLLRPDQTPASAMREFLGAGKRVSRLLIAELNPLELIGYWQEVPAKAKTAADIAMRKGRLIEFGSSRWRWVPAAGRETKDTCKLPNGVQAGSLL